MQDRRVEKGVRRGPEFEMEIDGETVRAFEGESIAAVMLAAGKRCFRRTTKSNQPRGLFCGIGLCQECLVVVNGQPNIQACQTLASPGCRVDTQTGVGEWEVGS